MGRVRILVDGNGRVDYQLVVVDEWRVRDGVLDAVRDDVDAESPLRSGLVDAFVRRIAELMPDHSIDAAAGHVVAVHAKAVCELSRNSVAQIREIRYLLEEKLADESADETADEAHTWIVSSVLKLNILCGRVVDGAREAVREGMWSFIDDDQAYHAYRKLRDPSLIVSQPAATIETRTWMRMHDAAIRQCEQIAEQLNEESTTLVGLLEAASSISSSREADAQTRLNTLVALLSLGIGVPALVLALYGAQLILPLDTMRQRLAFLPIGLSLLVAAILAIVFAPKGQTRRIWIAAAVAVLGVLLCLVVGALVVIADPIPIS
ncbi:hypothetical protein [Gordonia insulae]|nr:hypothetical protein [Gordonia insulae]